MVKAIRIDSGHPDVVWEVQCRKHSLVDRRHEEFASQVCFYLLFFTHTDFVPNRGVSALAVSCFGNASRVSAVGRYGSPNVWKSSVGRLSGGICDVVGETVEKANGEKKKPQKALKKKKSAWLDGGVGRGRRKDEWASATGCTIAAIREG